MKLSFPAIAIAALAVCLMPTWNYAAGASATPTPATKVDAGAESSSSASANSADPEALLPYGSLSALSAQESTPAPAAAKSSLRYPRAELFLGYSYVRAMPTMSDGNRLLWLNGGSTSLAFNLNRYLGLVLDFGGMDDSKIRLNNGSNALVDSSGTVFTYLGGPRVSFRNRGRLTPFVQALFGAAHAGQVTLSGNCMAQGCTPLPSETDFAMTAGGGLDLRVSHHFALRLVQAEYLMTNFKDINSGKNAMQNDMRLSTGIVFRFGGSAPVIPPTPVTYSCSVNPSSVFPGDPITVTGTATSLNPARTATYTWSVDGGTVTQGSGNATIDTKNVAPGTYTLKGHVSEGEKPGESADCSSSYTVKEFEPPTISCAADPAELKAGETTTITASAVSPQNRPLTYSYSSSAGSISGTGTAATLTATDAPPGPITVTCNVTDDLGHTGMAETTVTVATPPEAVKPTATELCSEHFDRDARRPARVDNEAKACLDDVALDMQKNSDAKLAIVGNAASKEKNAKKLASERAVNTKAYLVGEKGIDASRIIMYSGSQDSKSVNMTLVPEGATLDTAGDTPIQ